MKVFGACLASHYRKHTSEYLYRGGTSRAFAGFAFDALKRFASSLSSVKMKFTTLLHEQSRPKYQPLFPTLISTLLRVFNLQSLSIVTSPLKWFEPLEAVAGWLQAGYKNFLWLG